MLKDRTLRYPNVGMEFGFFGSGLANLEKIKTQIRDNT